MRFLRCFTRFFS